MAEDQPGVVFGDADEKSYSTVVPGLLAAPSFSELEAGDVDDDVADAVFAAPYEVEGNDTSNFRGVSPEYRTYASEVDSPLDWDGSVPDNSQEKLDALGVDTDSGQGDAPGESDDDSDAQAKRPAAKKSAAPPLSASKS